ncbi:MAG: hypothetical protein BIFFINMI_02836 [Phycisphaerae bacterium]|nr:hypothetical protein [Phycisphaerae bacterium]
MRANRRPFTIAGRWLLAALFVCGLIATAPTVRAADDPASVLPDDTLLYLVVPSVDKLKADFKKTNVYGLYKDPAMQPFVGPAEAKIRAKVDEKLAEAWKKMGLEEPPKEVPVPTGRVALGLRMVLKKKSFTFTQYDDDGKPFQKTQEYTAPEPEFVIWAQMGDRLATAKQLIEKAAEKSVNDEGYRRQTDNIRGTDVVILTPPAPDKDKGNSKDEPVCYAIRGDTIVASNSEEFFRNTIARIGGAEAGATLADNAGFKSISRKLGADSANVLLFVNAQAIIKMVRDKAGEKGREQIEKVIGTLGLDGLTGLGVAMNVGASPVEDFRVRALVGMRGERKGVLALLTPASRPVRGQKMLTSDLVGFLVANYDIGRIVTEGAKLAEALTGQPVGQMMQGAMEQTAEGEGGRPAVNLQQELLGQMSGPVQVLVWAHKPYAAPDSMQLLVTLGLRDAKTFATALGRIHTTFIAQGNKETQQDFQGTTIFLLKSLPIPGLGGAVQKDNPISMAVSGSDLLLGGLKRVQQSIRDGGRQDLKSIEADAMYQHAARMLPPQAGLVFYENGVVAGERSWVQLKQLAKKAAQGGEGGEGGDDGPSGFNPMVQVVKEIQKYADFNALPDFGAVKKYFGASVGYLVDTDEGLLLDMVSVKPPAGN